MPNMDSDIEVTVSKRNRNQTGTDSSHYCTSNNSKNITGFGLKRDAGQDDIFNVGTDVLGIAMKAFTLIARTHMTDSHEEMISISIAIWEKVCMAARLTKAQFLQVKAYCDALHLYSEEAGQILIDIRYIE